MAKASFTLCAQIIYQRNLYDSAYQTVLCLPFHPLLFCWQVIISYERFFLQPVLSRRTSFSHKMNCEPSRRIFIMSDLLLQTVDCNNDCGCNNGCGCGSDCSCGCSNSCGYGTSLFWRRFLLRLHSLDNHSYYAAAEITDGSQLCGGCGNGDNCWIVSFCFFSAADAAT